MNRQEIVSQIKALMNRVDWMERMMREKLMPEYKGRSVDSPHPLETVKRLLRDALNGDMESEDGSIRITHMERYVEKSGKKIRVSIEMKDER